MVEILRTIDLPGRYIFDRFCTPPLVKGQREGEQQKTNIPPSLRHNGFVSLAEPARMYIIVTRLLRKAARSALRLKKKYSRVNMRVFCKRCNSNSAEMEGRGLPIPNRGIDNLRPSGQRMLHVAMKICRPKSLLGNFCLLRIAS